MNNAPFPLVFPLLFSVMSVYGMENKSIQQWRAATQQTKQKQEWAQSSSSQKNTILMPTSADAVGAERVPLPRSIVFTPLGCLLLGIAMENIAPNNGFLYIGSAVSLSTAIGFAYLDNIRNLPKNLAVASNKKKRRRVKKRHEI
jgi:hypothetical protein